MRLPVAATRALFGAFIALLLLSFGDIAPSPAQTTLMPVVVGPLNSASAAGVYYAVQQGLFAKAGLDVKIQPMQGGAVAVGATVGGAIDVGYGNILTIVEAHAKQIPVSLLAPGSLYESRAPVAKLLVAGDSPFKSAQDFIGKTIGVASLNDLTVLAMDAWLQHGNVDPSKVNFVEVAPAASLAALEAGRIAAVILYDPFLGAALSRGAKVIATPYDFIAPTYLISGWFVSNSWAATHRSAASTFARVLDGITPYISTHYDDLLPMISSYTKVSVEDLAKLPKGVVPTSLRPELLQPVIDAAYEFRLIAAPFKAREIISPAAP